MAKKTSKAPKPIPAQNFNLIGRFCILFEPTKPKHLRFAENVIYEITGAPSTARLTIKVAHGEEVRKRTFTVIGESQVGFFLNLPDALAGLEKINAYKAEEDAREKACLADVNAYLLEDVPPPFVHSRTRPQP